MAAPIYIQKTSGGAAGFVNSLATSPFGSNTTNGNAIVAIVNEQGQSNTTSVTDTFGNSYSRVGNTGTGTWGALSIWTATGITGGASHVVTGNDGSNVVCGIIAFEIQNLPASAFIIDGTNSGNGSGGSISSGNIATTNANDILIAASAISFNSATTWTVPGSFTEETEVGPASGNPLAASYRIVSSTGTYSATYVNAVTNQSQATLIVAFSDTIIPQVPTVTTQAESSIGKTSGTGNGNITSLQGASTATARGVVYDTVSRSLPGNVAPGSSGYSNNVSASGSFSTGAFTSSMTSLAKNTTYYVRAFAQNSAGYAYGSEVSFTVLASTPLYDYLSDIDTPFVDNTTSTGADKILLEDGSSFLLLEDNTSRLLLNTSYSSSDYVTYTQQTALSAGTTYYWRVRAKKTGGSYGAWSEVRSFGVSSGTFTRTHTTDVNKRLAGITRTHTTDVYKRINPKTHTTDILKRKATTKTHTTDTYVRMRPVSELVDDYNDNSIDTNLWSATNASESSQKLNMVGAVSGAMNSVKRYNLIGSGSAVQLPSWAATGNAYVLYMGNAAVSQFVCWYLSGTTLRAYMYNGGFNQQGTTPTYVPATHAWFRIRESAGTVYWDYSADGLSWTNHTSMSTASLPFDTNNVMQSFSSNGQTSGTTSWDNYNVTPSQSRTHTTDVLKRGAYTRTHTTDLLKRKVNTLSHTTDILKRKVTTLTHSTDVNKRKVVLLTHSTDVNKKKAGVTRTHTTDVLKHKLFAPSHTTDMYKRIAFTRSHTTDSLLRKINTRVHTTDANKRKLTTKTHTTDTNKRLAGITRSHTTDVFKRKQVSLTHTTDMLKRKATVKTHTTDVLKRKLFTRTHTTDVVVTYNDYSREDTAALPTDDDTLATRYTGSERADVAADDTTYVDLTGTNFLVHEFKHKHANGSSTITPTCNLKSSLAPSSSTVYLQIYNYNTTAWETLDSDSTTAASTDFTLTGSVTTSVTNYYATGNWVSCRVYQEVI